MDRPIKTLYRALPSRWVQPVRARARGKAAGGCWGARKGGRARTWQIRDVLEFAGGSMDTMLPRATSEETLFDKRPKFRVSPACVPRAEGGPGGWRTARVAGAPGGAQSTHRGLVDAAWALRAPCGAK
jgi:hypothetical protein